MSTAVFTWFTAFASSRKATGAPSYWATSTARAVAYSALTTIASFGSLGLATHLGLATLGRLLTIGVGFTLVCNLIVLPALIRRPPGRSELGRIQPHGIAASFTPLISCYPARPCRRPEKSSIPLIVDSMRQSKS